MLGKVVIVLAIRRHGYMRLADDDAIHTAVDDSREQCRLPLIPMLACGGGGNYMVLRTNDKAWQPNATDLVSHCYANACSSSENPQE